MSEQTSSGQGLGSAAAGKVRMTYTEFLDKSPMTGFLWFMLFGLCLAQLLDGMDFQSTAFALPGIIRGFKLNPAQGGAVFSIGNIGIALGAIFFPMLCDIVGRKVVFQWVILTYAVGALLSAVAPSYQILLIGRFVAGTGLGAQLPIVFAILAEFAPARLRHIFIPMGPLFWAIGWIIAALLSIWLIPAWGWRSIYWVGVIPAAMTFFVRFAMPESVRYLLSKGKIEEAGRITENLAKRAGMTNLELVPPVLGKKEVKMTFGEQLGVMRASIGPMLVLMFFFFCFFVQSWGVNAWLPTIFVRQGFTLTKSFWFTLLIFAVVPFSQGMAAWLQDKMQRKWALFTMSFASAIMFLIFGLSLEFKWPIYIIVGSQIVRSLVTEGIVSILFTLSAELFPTPVRTFGVGIVNGIGRFGAFVGPLLLGFLLYFGTAIHVIIYGFATPLIIAAIVAVIFIKIDSRQRALEDIGAGTEQTKGMVAGH